MNRPKILRPNESYTFAKYFELAYDIEDILADVDCGFDRALLTLPKTDRAIPEINDLHQQILDGIQYRNTSQVKSSLHPASAGNHVQGVALAARQRGTCSYHFSREDAQK